MCDCYVPLRCVQSAERTLALNAKLDRIKSPESAIRKIDPDLAGTDCGIESLRLVSCCTALHIDHERMFNS